MAQPPAAMQDATSSARSMRAGRYSGLRSIADALDAAHAQGTFCYEQERFMSGERWQEVKAVLESALQLDSADRSAYLDQACSCDPSLRREVESLLAADQEAQSGFLQSPALERKLEPGTRLGDYEIQSLLGAGGMGEVYRARDLRLRRDVAIKVLPAMVSTDPERLRRFEQEATAAAALSHPNILAVYRLGTYVGTPYLVSELLEGETLREQLRRERIGLRRVVDYAVQIAHGLAAAHEKGIVHRDLKPENLFITKDGRVKILDFGLAKLTQPQPGSEHTAPTMNSETEAGIVMGTVGYMSPEQVRGQPADHRADIFALGAILYEMLTGKRAFQKPTSPETMTAILNEDPQEISQIVQNVPAALHRIVDRCLEKKPEQRFQSTTDLTFALEALSDSGATSNKLLGEGFGSRWNWISISAMAAAVVALIVAVALVGPYSLRRPTKLTNQDTIVLSDFENKTGDAIFDDTLKTALAVSLRQSPFLDVLSDNKVATTLQMMARPATAPLTSEVTREVCQRTASKAYIAGSVAALGQEYVLGLKAVNCQSGDLLVQEQATAASKEKVLDALGEAASKLRGQLGESLASIQKLDVPLTQATTSSLEALKAYTVGRQSVYRMDSHGAIPLLKRAIELDPNFATAWETLSIAYSNIQENQLAEEYAKKAFEVRDHASEREKLYIAANYYDLVTGELEKEIEVWEVLRLTYPREQAPMNNLGWVYEQMGELEKAAEEYREASAFHPAAVPYQSLARMLLFLDRREEAEAIMKKALAQNQDTFFLHVGLYVLAFEQGDKAAMERQIQWAVNNPEEYFITMYQGSAALFEGKLHSGLDLGRRANDLALRQNLKSQVAFTAAYLAMETALIGDCQTTRHWEATLQDPASRDATPMAVALALCGHLKQSQALVAAFSRRWPADSQLNNAELPLARAAIELQVGHPARAIELLQSVGSYERYRPAVTYFRGLGYLRAGKGAEAAAEFEKIAGARGADPLWSGRALSYLQLGRAYALAGDAPKSRKAYEDFLTLWKDADPDIPILKQVKAEYAKVELRSGN